MDKMDQYDSFEQFDQVWANFKDFGKNSMHSLEISSRTAQIAQASKKFC